MQKRVIWLFFSCLGLYSVVTQAAGIQSIDSIQQAARQFIAGHTQMVYQQPADISIGKLDSRLRLSRCSMPLEVYLPTGSRDLGRFTVGVRCVDQKPWSLHVPVTVTIYKKVVVTAESLPRGKILTTDDLKIAKYDKSKLPAGYIDEFGEGVGMELKRQLSNGVPLTASMIRKPKIIKRGQQVAIIARAGGMEVRMTGKALAHGAVGDRILVLNLKSKKKVEGTVTSSGDIRVDI
jgi:flagella basal body P-ring formation protein FlgA